MGMIARKDTLMKYGVFPNERMQRDSGAEKNRAVKRNSAVMHGTRKEPQ